MVAFSTFNPSCYLPSTITSRLPTAIACAPPSTVKTIYDTLTSPFSSTYTTLTASMEAIMGLPFLSFLLIPTMTSYSTSLNLLFFYLTWSTLVLSHPPLRVEVVASLAVRILFYVLPSLFFLGFDILIPSLSESFKSLGVDALPLRKLSRKNAFKHAKIVAWSLFNVVMSAFLQGLIEWVLVTQLKRPSALKVTTTLPLPWAILKDLLRGLIFRDILAWTIHRYLLHNSNPPNNVVRDLGRMHESWYHTAIRVPFPVSPTYDHPLVFIVQRFLPTYLPAMFWRFHMLTYMLYLMLVSLEETFTHSGYAKIPTNFILGGIANRNELHCLSKGKGNYGTWGLADWLFGTSVGGDVAEDILDEMDEADVTGKLSRGAGRSVAKVKRTIARTNGVVDGRAKPRRRTKKRSDESSEE